MNEIKSTHWADITADKIVREKGDKELYTCASGITPSGTVHIGNFREIMSVDLVVRALREKGKNVRFIYSWDDYDVFRKVPANMPRKEELESYLRQPITLVPDVLGEEESYAAHNEKVLEALLPLVGIEPDFIYQAKAYRSSQYAEGIKKALDEKETLRECLDEHRTSPLPGDWQPVSVFCSKCNKDTTTVTGRDGDWGVHYTCQSCGNEETADLKTTAAVKLPWRIDWPMRWRQEGVDFEPAGKDHHTEGGSFDTARNIVRRVYDVEPPVTFQYDFISIKGRGGKISSSTGEVVSLADVLEVYQPEVTRFLFAGTRPNTEFAISFDLDVLKIYEDYDKCERTFFQKPESEKALKKWAKQARIYELSQVGEVPKTMPYQIQIRHLCNLLQINDGDIDRVASYLGDITEEQMPRFRKRAECAWNWVKNFAPEDFRFALKTPGVDLLEGLTADERGALVRLGEEAEAHMDAEDPKTFSSRLYAIAEDFGLETTHLFPVIYRALIGKEKGPRLASFIYTIGRKRFSGLLKSYVG